MTDNNNDFVPTPETVFQWHKEACRDPYNGGKFHDSKTLKYLAACAAKWGADQELEACREWLSFHHYPGLAQRLRVVRRPKPPSEAEQALAALMAPPKAGARTITVDVEQYDAIFSALLHLKKLESAND